MPKFWMSSVGAAVEFAIEHDSAADASPDRHVEQPRLMLAGAPTCLGQRGRVRIVFQGGADVENAFEVAHQLFLAPSGKKINVAKLSGNGVDRARGSNSNA